MFDLLTKQEDVEAAAMGWELCHVYDLATSKWSVMVLAQPHAEFGAQLVISQARSGSQLAQKALHLVMTDLTKKPTRKKK